MNCICCDSTQLIHRRNLRGYKMMKCSNCTFVFVHPLPGVEEIEKFYNKACVVSDIKQIISHSIADFSNSEHAPKRDWFNKVITDSQKLTKKEKLQIFEIGSGYGFFVHYANTSGHHAIGTEVTLDYANAGKGIINGEVKYVPDGNYDSVIENNWADLIYMEHVFEHIMQPQQIIHEVKRKLAPGGVFYISVPNSSSMLAGLMGSKWPWARPPSHLYFYNKKSLCMFLERNGFEILQCFTGDYFRSIYQLYSLIPYVNIIRKKLKLTPIAYKYPYPKDLKNLFDIMMLLPYWILYPVLKLTSSKFGNELTVIAGLKDLY